MGKAETAVEKYLNKKIKELGGLTRKYVSPGHVGVADRLCFLPRGIVFLVEIKSSVGEETVPQIRERTRMLKLGQNATIIYGKKGVDKLSKTLSFL